VADQGRIKKRYEGRQYTPNKDVIDCLNWIKSQGETIIKFSREAWDIYKKIDEQQAEPLKESDGVMAGRLSEQAIKLAGQIALSDKRLEISANDLETAYQIRLGIYERTKVLLQFEGAICRTCTLQGRPRRNLRRF
jgi:hypothetical protein